MASSTKTANYFSQIFTSTFTADISDDESRQKEYEEKKKLLHRQKYVPAVKAENELFDSNLHVNAGPEFMENYGSQHDGNIVVSCNNARLTNIRYPSNFEECNFTRQIIENIKRKNFNDPTQVQKAMILLIKGLEYDIVGRAQTGSGKTAAFLLPIIDELHREYIQGIAQFNSDSPYAIIIAPTRELVNQIYEDTCTFSKDTSIKVAVAYGDVPMEFSIRELHKGCDILCSTIGRLCHYTKEQIIRLDKVRYFIIDEADWFLSQQRSDTIEDIRYINSLLPQKHRTFMMSATFDERSELAAKQFLHEKYVFVHIPQTINTISHKFLKVDKFSKMSVLINLLKGRSTLNESDGLYDTEKTIVFKNGRRECDRLGVALSYYGYRAITINRNRTMQQRRDAVDKFTMGIYNIVVSTDIIGRGLNFPNVEHVINFDLPKFEDYNQYIHRVGRTGRTGNFGCATSFFDVTSLSDTSAALFYAKTLEDLKQPVPDFLISIIRFQQEIKEEYQRQNQPNATLSHKGNNADMESAEQMKNILW